MSIRLLLIVALLSGLPCAEQVLGATAAPAPSPDPSQAAPTAEPPPLRIVADVMIDGRGPFHFMFDTGATQSVIADSTVARLGLQADPHRLIRVQGVNSRVIAPEVHVVSLAFGGLQFRHIDLPVLAGPFFDNLDGILGVQGLDRMKLSVSVLDRRCIIAISPRHADMPVGGSEVRMLAQRLPMVAAKVAGIPVRVIIDTGASNTLGNPTLLAALQKAGVLRVLHAAPKVLDVTPVPWTGLSGVTPPLQLGRVALQPPAVTFGDYQIFSRWGLSRRPALLLGMDALATLATFSIDYPRLQLQLAPRPPAMLSRSQPAGSYAAARVD